jgi:uncharacterized protein (TIGR04255 family)
MTEPTARKKYANPPIEEALVEFRFVPGQEWDLTFPGKFHQHAKIKDAYPGKPRMQKFVEAALQTTAGGPPNFAFREGVGRVQLLSEDSKRLVTLGPDVLSINVLRPYDDWERFRPRIETALAAYVDVATPKAVARVGVRYINRIVLPGAGLDVSVYFHCSPPTGTGAPAQMVAFVSRVDYAYPDGAKLLLTHATMDAPAGQAAFLLDLDVFREASEPFPIDTVMGIVDELHEREGTAFEAALTEAARKVFDET